MYDTLALAVGASYELVVQNEVTAFPCCAPYPIKLEPLYICPIKKGGLIDYIYRIDAIVDAYPGQYDEYKDILSAKNYQKLNKYHKERLDTYEYSHKNTIYRYFVMTRIGNFNEFYIKNIQIGKKLESNMLPMSKI